MNTQYAPQVAPSHLRRARGSQPRICSGLCLTSLRWKGARQERLLSECPWIATNRLQSRIDLQYFDLSEDKWEEGQEVDQHLPLEKVARPEVARVPARVGVRVRAARGLGSLCTVR